MKRYMPFSGCLAVVVLLFTGLTGCIRDDRDHCCTSYKLVVKTVESDSVAEGDIGEVVLFIFDAQQKFRGSMKTQVGQVTELSCPSTDGLYVVAWGNINGQSQSLSVLNPGDSPEDSRLKLNMKDNDNELSPDDLFQGIKMISLNAENSSPDVLWIKRKVAMVTVATKGVQQYANTTDEDFSYVIRGTSSAIDLGGNLASDEARLNPAAAFDGNQVFITPSFRVFPAGHISVDIYKAGQLIYSVDQDDAGNPFAVFEGKKLTIFIDLSGNIHHVTISISDWQQTDVTVGL